MQTPNAAIIAQLQAALLSDRATTNALKNPHIREEIAQCAASGLPTHTIKNMLAESGVTLSGEHIKALRKAPPEMSVSVSASAPATPEESKNRVTRMLSDTGRRMEALARVFEHQYASLEALYIETGRPIPEARLRALLQTADSAGNAARTFSGLLVDHSGSVTVTATGHKNGDAPLSVGQVEGKTAVLILPPSEDEKAREAMHDIERDTPKWEPFLP